MKNRIEGLVEAISESGDLITDIRNESLAHVVQNQSVTISVSGHETIGIYPANHREPENTLVAFLGDSGSLRVGIVGVDLNQMLQIGIGARVTILW